ncbi:MAG: FAD-dependent pyridine nucleotide-disulfide oxidoreductase [Chloroflexi bacterium]|nr:FAD-dependent pyridine nucleotide-disulfide oxidoreductase [Chloroflexota bacterium]
MDAQYRHSTFPEIYAAGVAAQAEVPAPQAGGLPKTGYLAAAMARIAARNIAAAITQSLPVERSLPRLLDLRILDGGDTGVLLISADVVRPLRLAVPLPGRSGHWLKGLLTRYLLWKLRTGRTYLP